MPNRITELTKEYKQQRIQKRKSYVVLTTLAVVATVVTVWALIQPASAMTGKAICGIEEHTHTDACYERRLICEQEENDEHSHSEECWEMDLICQLPEHMHIAECYEPEIVEPEKTPEAHTENQDTVKPGNEASSTPQVDNQLENEANPETDTDKTEIEENKSDNSLNDSDSEELTTEQQPQKPTDTEEIEEDEKTVAEEESEEDLEQLTAEQLPKEIPAEYTDVRTAQMPGGGGLSVYSKPGAIDEAVEVKVNLLAEDSTEFEQTVQRLQTAGIAYDFVKALDISLSNSKGEEIEPQAPVYVVMDAGALLPQEANRESIQIQHHMETPKAIDATQMQDENEPEIKLESVLNQARGLIAQGEEDSCIVTFPVDSFSVFTITSQGWKDLNIKVQCVDEYGEPLPVKPGDIQYGPGFKPDASFDIVFNTTENNIKIDGYQYDGKAYYMEDGHYQMRIYGLRRRNNTWYYFPNDGDKNTTIEFQPKFLEPNPRGSIRLIYKKIIRIPVQYRDVTSYEPLPDANAPGGNSTTTLTVYGASLDLSDISAMPKCNTHFYVGKAYVGEHIPQNEVVQIISKEDGTYGITAEEREVKLTDENPLLLLYAPIQTETPSTIETVSTRDKGLVINLFDYNSGQASGADEGINKGKNLQFVQDASRKQEYNRWTGKDGGIYTGIVQKELVNGYPMVEGQSLDYLFNPDICREELITGEVRHVHTNLDHLFWQDKDGYYRYDAMTNFATIMDKGQDGSGGHNPNHMDGGNFIVYSQPAMPSAEAAKFLPFNKYAEANRPNVDPEINERIKEFHFGMTMQADFLMPPGGEVVDADGNHVGLRDMIFEFNGDDDVWVFIDDKLALDLGGIHGRYGGTINFRTGEVTTNAPTMEHSGRRQDNLYGITSGANQMSPEQLAEYRAKAGFGDYTEHTFKFFYLERGRGASNCEIRFNLVPASHRLVVGKRLPVNGAVRSTTSPTSHMWYKFRAETAIHKDGILGERKPLANAPFMVLQWDPNLDVATGGLPIRPGTTDESGYFWLRADERAQFTDVIDLKNAGNVEGDKDDVHIYVSEILPQSGFVQSVRAWTGSAEKEGTYKVVVDSKNKETKVAPPLYDALNEPFHTDLTEVSLSPTGTDELVYEVEMHCGRHNQFNWVDFENDLGESVSLNIIKQALRHDETPIVGVPFTIKVELWDNMRNDWIPISDGSPYWILPPGDTKPEAGAQPNYLPEGAGGQVNIQHGQTIHFELLPGTKYKVSEVLSPEDSLLYTTYYRGLVKVQDIPVDNAIEVYDGAIGSVTGVQEGSTHKITIVNHSDAVIAPNGAFSLTKKVTGIIPPNKRVKFDFALGLNDYQSDQNSSTDEIQCTAIYYDTPWERQDSAIEQDGVWVQNISFKKDSSGKWGTNIFLYPGETVVIAGLPKGVSLSIEELFQEDEAGNYTVSFQEEKQDVVPGTRLDSTVGRIHPNSVVKVTCLNESMFKSTDTLKITKQVKRTDRPDGAPTIMDRVREFDFNITLQKTAEFAGGATKVEVPAELQTTNGAKAVTLTFTKMGQDYVAEYVKIKHGETLTIPSLPTEINVVVQEIGHKGYAVSMNRMAGDSTTVYLETNTGKPYEVVCVNMTGVELPATGGHGLLPYYLFAAMIMGTAGLLLYWRRREH